MPVHNAEIAVLFNRLADLLEVEDANPFRVRAYRNAARTISGFSKSMADLLAQGKDLSKLPGIGKDLAKKISTIVETGKLPLLAEVEAHTPAALSELMKIEGLGPKRVKVLYQQLHISSVEDLKRAARSGKIRELAGFGSKTEEKILQKAEHFGGAEHFSGAEQRLRLADAEEIVRPLLAWLQQAKGIKDVSVAGSFRRRRETVGDLDILATATRDSAVMERFANYDEVDEVVSSGKTRATVILRSGLQVDLRVVPQASQGAALCYFTGSKAHNIALRKLALGKGCKLNEYGVFKNDRRIAGAHPSGRLINEREAYDVDLEKIISAAKQRGCFLEVNAQPARLDLADSYCKLAKEAGVKVAISTDAHSRGNLDYMRFGVDQARRGWLEAADILNTHKLAALRKLLQRQ